MEVYEAVEASVHFFGVCVFDAEDEDGAEVAIAAAGVVVSHFLGKQRGTSKC